MEKNDFVSQEETKKNLYIKEEINDKSCKQHEKNEWGEKEETLLQLS